MSAIKKITTIDRFATLVLAAFLILFAGSASGQNYKNFPSVISTDLTLEPGDYAVKGNNIVRNGGILRLNAGTNLHFAENAVIQIEGGLEISGKANNFVQVTNIDNEHPGMGFSILYQSNDPISIDYADFRGLKKPLKLNKYWLRPAVTVQHSMFRELHDGVYLEILEMDKIQATQKVTVSLTGNTFANNTGSIMISDAAWDLLHFDISNNVFSRNEFIGRELNGIFTTPLFINYNETEDQYPQPTLENNSICYNYIGVISPDTVEFLPVYVTTVGSADKINISPNYFGKDAEKYLSLNSEIIHTTQRAPFIEFSNPLEKPLPENNGHYYQVGVNGVEVDNPGFEPVIDRFTEVIELISNKSVIPTEEFDVTYIYLYDDTLRKYQLKNRIEFEDGNQRTMIYIVDKIIKQIDNGYIEIKGLKDQNGFIVPTVNIGMRHFLNKNREFINGYRNYMAIPRMEMTAEQYELHASDTTFESTPDTSLSIDEERILVTKKYWDFGVTTSSTIYFGDLASTSVSIYLPNARPQLGFRLGYNFNKKWKVQLSQNTLLIAGDDSKSSQIGKNRGTNFERGLSFRTTIVDLGLNAVFRPFNYEQLKGFIPSIHAGVSGFYFNPQGKYEDTWYNLRPIGTEGQTLSGATEAYSKFAVSIPMGIMIERHLSQNFILGFGYTYHKLFTDYLDDVSTGSYPDADSLKAVNPDLGDIAVSLSNPNGLTGQRSFSDDNDGFSYFGFSFTWKL